LGLVSRISIILMNPLCNLYGRPSVSAPPYIEAPWNEGGAPTEGRPYRFIIFTVTED